MSEHASEDTHVPHEAAVDAAIDDQLARTSTHAFIADPTAPGSSYAQAEAASTRNAVVGILAILKDAGLMPSS